MIYTKLTVKAMNIAYDAHQGVYDKGGVPYVFHPFHVAEQMDTEYEVCIALLHDVVEDTDYTFEDFEKEGFPMEIIEALKLLTKKKGQNYMEYIDNIKGNPMAIHVKLADLEHNSDKSRIPQGEEEKYVALRERYKKAKEVLQKALQEIEDK